MSNLKITGKLLGVTPFRKLTEKFGIEEMYLDVTDNPEYPNQAKFQINNEKVKVDFPKGTELEVHFNIQGRKFEKKDGSGEFFAQNLVIWKVLELAEVVPSVEQPQGDVGDNLPF